MKVPQNLLVADRAYLKQESDSLVGLDEAGRGALAGPVFVGAVWIDKPFFQTHQNDPEILNIQDSKQRSPQQREAALHRIQTWSQSGHLIWTFASGSVEEIEQDNILQTTQNTFVKAIQQLQSLLHMRFGENTPIVGQNAHILVDGNALKKFPYPHQNCVQGDSRHFCIAAASIIAKTQRDAHMCQLHTRYPAYHFDQHKGYGTQQHLQILLEKGPCDIHRPSFLKKLFTSSTSQQMDLEGI